YVERLLAHHEPAQKEKFLEPVTEPIPSTTDPQSPFSMRVSRDMPDRFGRYRIVKKLGEGGMGTVYLAHDTKLDRPVALKVPHFTPFEDARVIDRVFREARAAAKLNHPSL